MGSWRIIILAMLSAIKYLQSHMYDTNYSHCNHKFVCHIMLWIHFLNISSRGRRKSRWNKRIAEQNPGGVEAGALYGGENTHQVKESNIYLRNLISWTLGSMFYMYSNSHPKFFMSLQCFYHNCICTYMYLKTKIFYLY